MSRVVIIGAGHAGGSAAALLRQYGFEGEIVMIGAPWGGDENSVPSSRLTRDIFFRFLRLRSGSEWEIPRQDQRLVPDSIRANSATGLAWLADGRLRAEPLITHRLPASEIAAAYRRPSSS